MEIRLFFFVFQFAMNATTVLSLFVKIKVIVNLWL